MIRTLINFSAKPQPSTVEADFDAACDDMQARMLAMISECPGRRFRSGDFTA